MLLSPTKARESAGAGTSTWRVWLLLLIVIQLTVWVRGLQHDEQSSKREEPHTKDQQQGEEEEQRHRSAATTATTMSVTASDNKEVGDSDPCSRYLSCGACTFTRFKSSSFSLSSTEQLQGHPTCHWCSVSSTCFSTSRKDYCMDPHTNTSSDGISYQYDCPLGPIPYPDHPPNFLPNWMGEFYQAGLLDNVCLVDLSLPGSHDSLSYDLSLTVSEDGIDSYQELAKLLHAWSAKILPGDLEEFFRMQAKTQELSLSQQLDNGVRFLDIRIMFEPDKKEWFSIHFMQSKRHAVDYLQEIRQWLDDHPHEVIVIWLSKHGNPSATGSGQYPGVSPAEKEQFWTKYCNVFEGLLMMPHDNNSSTTSSVFTTPLAELIENNQRVITFASDYVEFTQSSPYAYDAATIQNTFDDGDAVLGDTELVQSHVDYFKNATVNNAYINDQGGFTLMAMNTASPSWQVIAAAKQLFLHWLGDDNDKSGGSHLRTTEEGQPLETDSIFDSCPSHIKIPGVNHWCPRNLMDISQLASYYNQIAIETAYQHSYTTDGNTTVLAAFPNAFYLDALDYNGTMRVGPQLLDGSERGDLQNNRTTKYALVDTILLYNVRVACARRTTASPGNCDYLFDLLEERRQQYPLQRWEEPNLGRHTTWPQYSYDNDSDNGDSEGSTEMEPRNNKQESIVSK